MTVSSESSPCYNHPEIRCEHYEVHSALTWAHLGASAEGTYLVIIQGLADLLIVLCMAFWLLIWTNKALPGMRYAYLGDYLPTYPPCNTATNAISGGV